MSWTGPSASVSWNDLANIRVYAQDPDGNIMEWQADADHVWSGPTKLPYRAKYGTPMSATMACEGSRDPKIRLYYFGEDGGVKEAVYEGEWGKGSTLP